VIYQNNEPFPVSLVPLTSGRNWRVTVVSAAFLCLLVLPATSIAQSPHPKALFDSTDVAELLLRKDGSHSTVWAALLDEISEYGPPSEFFINEASAYGERLLNLALVAMIDSTAGSPPAKDLFLDYFDAMRSYAEWDNVVPFNSDIIVSAYLMTLALSYDLHYSGLGEERREETADLLLAKATEWEADSPWFPGEEHVDEYGEILWDWRPWFTGNHAFRNYAGVASVAFILSGERDTQALIDRTEEILVTVSGILPPDGSLSEGADYNMVTKLPFLVWMTIRDNYLSTNSLLEYAWFNESVMFDLYSILPGGEDNFGGTLQFGDARTRPRVPFLGIEGRLGASGLPNAPVAQWIAEQLDDESYDCFTYLWSNPGPAIAQIEQVPTWHTFPDRGLFVWRSSWADTAVHFAIKSGPSFGGHDQPDIGSIVLSKAGIPYLTDYGISRCFRTDEHNVILVDGEGQYGEMEGGGPGGEPIHPDHWGTLSVLLGDNGFFDVVADPTKIYKNPLLDSWKREVIGIGGEIFVVRDWIDASQSVRIEHLFHSFKSEPYDGDGVDLQFQPSFPYDANPWTSDTTGEYLLEPRAGAMPMYVTDVSIDAWNPAIEASWYIPKVLPDGSKHEIEGCGMEALVQLGGRLRRSRTGSDMSSLVALRFDPSIAAVPVSATSGEGIRLTRDDEDFAVIVWPDTPSRTNIAGLQIEASMAGLRSDSLEFFGREVTLFRGEGSRSFLISSNQPLSTYVRHQTGFADSSLFLLNTTATSTTVFLSCPVQPVSVSLDGVPFSGYRWKNGALRFINLTPGEYRFTAQFPGSQNREDQSEVIPALLSGIRNYPNPFNPSTTIRYRLGADSPVTLKVYNVLGQEVVTLVDGFQKAGDQSVVWHGTNNLGQAVASGLYFYRIQTGSILKTHKMLFAK